LPLFGGVEGSWSGTVEGMSFPLNMRDRADYFT
jgi:hypothetical protein